jgi:hypothetical protein
MLPSDFRFAALARVATAVDADSERLQLAGATVDCMRTFTSLCGSVRAVTTKELLQLLQLRRLPPAFITHCVQRLDPSECGFINAVVVRDFLCACSIVRESAVESMRRRVHLVQKSVYVRWLNSIQVKSFASARLHGVFVMDGISSV